MISNICLAGGKRESNSLIFSAYWFWNELLSTCLFVEEEIFLLNIILRKKEKKIKMQRASRGWIYKTSGKNCWEN